VQQSDEHDEHKLDTPEAVEIERQRYQELFEFAPHGYLVTDMQGVIYEANRVAAALLGVRPQSLVGKPLSVYAAMESRPQLRSLVQGVGEFREGCEWEGQMRRRPGIVFDAALTAVTACDIVGRADNDDLSRTHLSGTLLWILRDITDRNREEQMWRRQTEVLTATLSTLAVEPQLDTFLRQVLSAVGEQLQATRVVIWFYDGVRNLWTSGQHWEMQPRSGAEPARSNQLPAHEWRLWHELLRSRQPVEAADLESDPRITARDDREFPGNGNLLLVPMLLGDDVLGMLHIYAASPRRHEVTAIRMIQALAQQATLAVQLTRLAEREQQSLVLQERNRMAREIHDTLTQGFTSISIQLEAAEDALNGDIAQALEYIARARELAHRSLKEARRSAYALRPELLEHPDLPDAIGRIVEQVTAGTGLTMQFQVYGDPKPLPTDIEDHLLWIVHEALMNVLKHADAEHVEITVDYRNADVVLIVHDDGRGFVTAKPRLGSMGLIGMRERTVRLGGRFELESSPGDGTWISASAPLL
jgi:PAS domain S-box-containing protein